MKRIAALFLAAALLVSALSGCAKTETETTAQSSSAETESTEGKEGKIRTDIVTAEPSDIVTLDPSKATDAYSSKAIGMIFDTLIDIDADSNFVPGLATEWEMKEDLTLVLKIRENVKFHNGEILTPSDVKFSLDRVAASPETKIAMADVEEVIADDENMTVSVKLKRPSAAIYVNLSDLACHIVNQKAVKEMEAAGEDVGQNPIGTGPMKLQEWKPNDECTLVRFDEHWAGTPKTTSIKMRVIPEPTSRTIALETGEVDMVTPISAVDIERVEGNEHLKTMEVPSSAVIYISPNQNKEPFDNKLVRQAMHYATNKEAMIEVIYEGYALPGVSPFPTVMPFFDESLEGMYSYDIEKAKALMTEAGFPDGIDRPVEICVSSEERNRAAQLLQADFAQIGIQLDIAVMEYGTLMEHCNAGTHDLFIAGWSQAVNQDKTMRSNFHSDSIGPTGNRSWCNNPEIDALIDAGAGEMDAAKREEIYKELQYIIMDEAVWIPLWQQMNVYGLNAGLEGVEWYKRGGGYYANAYVVEE